MRPDGVEAERAGAAAFGRNWIRAPMYGRARRLMIERTPEQFLEELARTLGPLADRVRVAPEDMRQTKWDAMSRLAPLSRARSSHQLASTAAPTRPAPRGAMRPARRSAATPSATVR